MVLDVLIIGAGPVGLTMASELARYGVSVRIIDQANKRSEKSKALAIWPRTLELINQMGCVEPFISTGLPCKAANFWSKQEKIARVRLDELDTPFPYVLIIPQSETERLLEEHLNQHGGQVERNVKFVDFDQEQDRVTSIVHHENGQEEVIISKWLIGCDGAHSTVRQKMGIQFEGHKLSSVWVLADAALEGIKTDHCEINLFWHKSGVVALFPLSSNQTHYRLIANISETIDGKHYPAPTIEEIQNVLDLRGPGHIKVISASWLSAFGIDERKVDHYRIDHVFLAGDAAHVHSPAGGQGMNTGMQDAYNLAWKLSLVCRNLAAAEPLLNSYDCERSLIAKHVLAKTSFMTAIVSMKSKFLQFVRNKFLSLFLRIPFFNKIVSNNLSEIILKYPHSPINGPSVYNVSPRIGERVLVTINQPIGVGDTPHFALFAKTSEKSKKLIARYSNLLESETRVPFNEENIWLVRPDGYVALITDYSRWDQVDTYLRQISK